MLCVSRLRETLCAFYGDLILCCFFLLLCLYAFLHLVRLICFYFISNVELTLLFATFFNDSTSKTLTKPVLSHLHSVPLMCNYDLRPAT